MVAAIRDVPAPFTNRVMHTAQFPVGQFSYTPRRHDERASLIESIAALPTQVRQLTNDLGDEQLTRRYRDGGWTVRQLLHHLPDSHMNGFIRFKLALTEDTPTIKPYDEARWAELADVSATPVSVSIALLEAVHTRWVNVLQAMTDADFSRQYVHPEHGRAFTLDESLASYAWHGRHHLAHLEIALSK